MRSRRFLLLLFVSIAAGVLCYAVLGNCGPSCATRSDWEGAFVLDTAGDAGKLADAGAVASVREVLAAADAGKLTDLIAKYRSDVAAEPGSAPARFALGYAYLIRSQPRYSALINEKHGAHKNVVLAVENLSKAVALDPDLREAVLMLSSYYLVAKPVQAVTILDEWLKHHPDDPWAMYLLSQAYGTYSPDSPDQSRYCHDEQKSLRWLEKAAHAVPDCLRFRLSLGFAYVSVGMVKDTSGNWVLAAPWQAKAVEEFKAVQRLAAAAGDSDTAALAARMLAKYGQG
jgi:hypothetical protein